MSLHIISGAATHQRASPRQQSAALGHRPICQDVAHTSTLGLVMSILGNAVPHLALALTHIVDGIAPPGATIRQDAVKSGIIPYHRNLLSAREMIFDGTIQLSSACDKTAPHTEPVRWLSH